VSLFGDSGGAGTGLSEPRLRECEPWSNIERLNRERELIGFYLSGHPLDRYREDAGLFASHTLSADILSGIGDRESVKLIGIITSVKRISDKKGRPMCFIQVEDLKGSIEVLIFSEVYDRHQGLIAPDTIVMLDGTLSKREEPPKIIASSLERVQNLREKYQKQLELLLTLNTSELSRDDLNQMASLFSLNKGETPVRLQVMSEFSDHPMSMNVRKFVVEPNNELLTSLRELLGKKAVRLKKNRETGAVYN